MIINQDEARCGEPMKALLRQDSGLALPNLLEDTGMASRRTDLVRQFLSNLGPAIATAADPSDALCRVLKRICEITGWTVAEAWVPGTDEVTLEPSAIGFWATAAASRFHDSNQAIRYGPGEGLPGRVWQTKQPLWIPDVKQAKVFCRTAPAATEGLQAAAGLPVMVGEQVVAVLVFLMDTAQPEDRYVVDLLALAAPRLAYLFLGRRPDAALRIREQQLPASEPQGLARLGSWEWNAAKDEFTCSDSLFAIMGLPVDGLSGSIQTFFGQAHPDDRPKLENVFKSALSNHQPFVFEARVLRPDGEIRFLRSQGEVIQHTDRTVRLFGLCQDVTLQKQAEEAQALAASLVAASDDAIIGKTLDGRIFSWNRGAERMFGYRATEVVGRPLAILIPPDRRDEENQLVQRVKHGRSLVQIETVRLRKDGRAIEVQLTASPVRGKDGKVQGASVVVRDISEVKRLEALVLEISEREQRRIGQDIHDGLNQQLSGIAYLTHLLTKKLRSQMLPEAEEAARIDELVAEASAQARVVARGLLPVKPEPNGLTVALHRLARRIRETSALDCWFVCEPGLQIRDNGLATHLYRIAQEAAHNAVKHCQGSEIVIHLGRRDGELELIVEDNGRGLPPGPPPRQSMGLETMRYRAHAIGARLNLQARRKHGLRVICSLPLPNGSFPVETDAA